MAQLTRPSGKAVKNTRSRRNQGPNTIVNRARPYGTLARICLNDMDKGKCPPATARDNTTKKVGVNRAITGLRKCNTQLKSTLKKATQKILLYYKSESSILR